MLHFLITSAGEIHFWASTLLVSLLVFWCRSIPTKLLSWADLYMALLEALWWHTLQRCCRKQFLRTSTSMAGLVPQPTLSSSFFSSLTCSWRMLYLAKVKQRRTRLSSTVGGSTISFPFHSCFFPSLYLLPSETIRKQYFTTWSRRTKKALLNSWDKSFRWRHRIKMI